MRYLFAPLIAVAVAFGLFWLMQWMTAAPDVPFSEPTELRAVEIIKPPEEEEQPEPETEQLYEAAQAPSAPPSAAAIDLPDQLSLTADSELGIKMDLPNLSVPVNIGGSAGFGDGFGGFGGAGGSGRGGAGSGGYGKGEGFKGARLVPISTARPQIPKIAYEQGIEGWVEVIFVVKKDGTVENVRIIDADPKGVFEATAVESISNWLYASHPRAREVKQKVYFKLEDFQYNWDR